MVKEIDTAKFTDFQKDDYMNTCICCNRPFHKGLSLPMHDLLMHAVFMGQVMMNRNVYCLFAGRLQYVCSFSHSIFSLVIKGYLSFCPGCDLNQ